MSRHSVVVVGGGISGLTAALELADTCDVVLIEGTAEVGGKLRGAAIAGTTVDVGAESMLARRPEAVSLTAALGLPTTHPLLSDAGILVDGRLVALPKRTVMGIPGSIPELRNSGVLSRAGLRRASWERWLPKVTVSQDVSVGELVAKRFGREVVDRLVEPLLGGVYASPADGLSLAAVAPALADRLRTPSRLTPAVGALTQATNNAPVFAAPTGGVHRLTAALRDAVMARGVDVRTGRPVTELRRGAVVTGSEVISADGVLLALPAAAAAKLLGHEAPASASGLGTIQYASVAIVTMAFDALPELHRSGWLVPAHKDRWVKAATLTSEKWGRTHYATDKTLLRASVGRLGETRALQVNDDELVERVTRELREVIRFGADPAEVLVTRWGGGLPQYAPGHLGLVDQVREGLPPRVVICGAAVDGVGIPACIASGRSQAAALLRELDA